MGNLVRSLNTLGAAVAMAAALIIPWSGFSSTARAASWSFVDGVSLSANVNAFPQLPVTAVHNGALYVAWYESLSSPPGIRIKKYDGSAWSNAGSSGATLVEGSNVYQVQPALASYNGSLYIAYVDYDSLWGNSRIHVKKYDGSSWNDANNNCYNIVTDPIGSCPLDHPHCNDYPGANINHIFNASATSPSLLAANGKLYAAWLEWPNGVMAYNIRVAELDTSTGTDWQMIDGGGNTGLNFNVNKNAVQAVSPLMAWYNGKLYVSWVEANVRVELRVKAYDPAAKTWAFVDGGTATGINYDTTDPLYRDALYPHLTVYNGALYAIWSEMTYNDPTWGPINGLRYKKFNGTTWSGDGSGDGRSPLNYDFANGATHPASAVNNNLLYLSWSEAAEVPSGSNDYFMQLRAASFDGTTRSFTDGGAATGLNATTTRDVDQEKLAVFNGDLYAVWHEMTGWPDYQDWIRVKKLPLPPYVTSVSVPSNTVYKAGSNLDFTVTFNKGVTVNTSGGTPFLPITLDTGGTVPAAYLSGSGTTTLVFRYQVQASNLDNNGIAVGAALNANGGTLRDTDANDVDLTLKSVPATTGILVDGIAPVMTSGTLAASNGYLDVTFSKGVYGASNGVTPLTAARLALTFIRNSGNATNVTISSVKKNNSTVEGSASPLTGGETTVRVFLTATGTPSGVETVEIKPASAAAIYDAVGNAMLASQTTGVKTLNDKLPPTLVSASRTDNTHLVVTLSENCANIAKANNGGLAVQQTGAPATTFGVTAIAQGVDASHVVLTVTDMGAASGSGVTVLYTAGGNGTIQDIAGNVLTTNAGGVVVPGWRLPSITALGSNGSPADFGQSVTFTATVSGSGVTPTGTVDFKEGAAAICSGVSLNGSGQATCASSSLSTGSHTITADYNGDSGYYASSGSITQNIRPAAPIADLAGSISDRGFIANWNTVSSATAYYLDVATDNGFTGFVSGYQNKDVGNTTSAQVTGLAPGTGYHYRLRAYSDNGASPSSNSISLTTLSGRVTGIITDPATPNALFAGVDGGGIFRSTDNGASWSPTSGQPASNRVQAVLLQPPASTLLLAATYGSGVFASSNGGANWSACTSQPANLNVLALAADSNGRLYAGTESGIFTSTDCSSWSAVNIGLTVNSTTPPVAIAIDPATPAQLYAGLDGAGVYKSTDSGATWTAATTHPANTRVKALVLKPGNSTKQYAATYGGGIYTSSDSGDTWSACANTNLTNLNVVSLTIDGNGKLYAGTEAGVFVSTDGCASWIAINTGLP